MKFIGKVEKVLPSVEIDVQSANGGTRKMKKVELVLNDGHDSMQVSSFDELAKRIEQLQLGVSTTVLVEFSIAYKEFTNKETGEIWYRNNISISSLTVL